MLQYICSLLLRQWDLGSASRIPSSFMFKKNESPSYHHNCLWSTRSSRVTQFSTSRKVLRCVWTYFVVQLYFLLVYYVVVTFYGRILSPCTNDIVVDTGNIKRCHPTWWQQIPIHRKWCTTTGSSLVPYVPDVQCTELSEIRSRLEGKLYLRNQCCRLNGLSPHGRSGLSPSWLLYYSTLRLQVVPGSDHAEVGWYLYSKLY